MYDEEAPLQAHVTNLDADNFLGRIALLRVEQGELRKGQTVAWIKRDGTISNVRITELMMTEALTRKPAEVAGPGDICAVARIPDIMIGETLADPENPIALPLITVDQPAISMTIGTNTSPLVGRGGTGKGADAKAAVKNRKVTARQVKDRWTASSSVTSRSVSSTPSARTRGRSRAAVSSRSPSWSSRCAARASS
ncbi:Elongation factor G, mitochondrial [Streptomyces tanashiensis]